MIRPQIKRATIGKRCRAFLIHLLSRRDGASTHRKAAEARGETHWSPHHCPLQAESPPESGKVWRARARARERERESANVEAVCGEQRARRGAIMSDVTIVKEGWVQKRELHTDTEQHSVSLMVTLGPVQQPAEQPVQPRHQPPCLETDQHRLHGGVFRDPQSLQTPVKAERTNHRAALCVSPCRGTGGGACWPTESRFSWPLGRPMAARDNEPCYPPAVTLLKSGIVRRGGHVTPAGSASLRLSQPPGHDIMRRMMGPGALSRSVRAHGGWGGVTPPIPRSSPGSPTPGGDRSVPRAFVRTRHVGPRGAANSQRPSAAATLVIARAFWPHPRENDLISNLFTP
ncbi:hypothetical protein AAFF_G00158380 [Aldrovandia affinis]|uniref:Uncharacterized protein n=1 Tax=Aldrovandia affinis TaxID=143900 RepID=A0AAD7W838_9TELE|nr:hypothetical protein AAFF_G00158380 [Aldrovandia affinis]